MADRILIVEDERITAEDLHDILVGIGYEVTGVVSSGADAIREVEQNPPDLALMDIRIKGDMDGTETARVLFERFGIPVVYLTAHADRETLNRAKRAKPLGYIIKPFQESEIQAAVEIALHRHRHDRKSKERQQLVSDVLRNLLLGVISVDGSEIVVLFNSAAQDLTGWTEEEAVGEPLRKVFRLTDSKTGKESEMPFKEVLSDGALREIRNHYLITKSGEHRHILGNMSAVPASPSGFRGAVLVFESADAAPGDAFLQATLKSTFEGASLQFGRFHVVAASDEMKKVLGFALRVARSEAATVTRRRERNRQGSDGAVPALFEQSPVWAFCAGQLRGDSRGVDRERIVRPPEGCVHRRSCRQERPVRDGERRNAIPR